MTISRFGHVGALVVALAFGGAAVAQETDEQAMPDNGDQMETMDGHGTGNAMTDEQATDAPLDPASPEAEGMDESMTEEQDMAEPEAEAAQEETGPAEMISDSSERALVEDELVGMTCDQLWIARNEIFDRNGYCFRSERGQAYFDNADCTSDSQDILSELEWQNVDLIKQVESEKQCG